MKVFVSAASGDLRSCREAVKDVLLQADIQPVTQEVLHADHRNLPEFLDALVQSCDAVVCLAGKVFGAAPEDEPHRSYTHREYDCARRLGKPVFVFLAHDDFYVDGEPEQPQRQADWQREHRQAIMGGAYCRSFSTQLELEKEVGVAVWSIHKSAGRIPVFFYHLPPTPPFFVGRADEKAQLLRAMSSRCPGVIAVVGMAGQGKSTLVHHVVAARQDDVAFPFQAGFWCTAGLGGFSFDMFLDEALACLTEGRFDKSESPKTQQRVQRLLGEIQQRPVLIVIDAIERWLRGWETGDADHGDVADEDRLAAFEGLDGFLMQATALANGSHVVITSRAMPDVLEDADKIVIPVRKPLDYDIGLQGLAPADAVALLKSYGLDASDERLETLASQLGFHPLAMRVFGGYVKKKYGGALDKATNLTAWDRKKTLARLFDEVYERLPGGAASRRFLEVVSCTIEEAPLDVLEAVLEHDGDDDPEWDARDIALMLADWQVINFDTRSGAVGMHALLKEHFGKRLGDADRAALHRRFAQWYGEQPIAEAPTTLVEVRTRLLSLRHALAGGDLDRCEHVAWGQVTPLYCLVEWLGAFGHFVHGAELLEELAVATTGRLRARVRIARAVLLRPVGEHHAARADLDEAIDILGPAEAPDPGDVPDLAGALSNRGTVFLELVQYPEAVADFDRALELLEGLPGEEAGAFQIAAVHANRAMVLREMGCIRRAIADCSVAIETHRTRLEPLYQRLNPDLAAAYSNRGNAHRDLHCHDDALADYRAALNIHANLVNIGQEQFRGPQALGHVLVGSVLQDIQRHAEAIGQLDEAVAAYRDLIRVGKKHFDPMLAFALARRGWSLAVTGNIEDGLNDSTSACTIYGRLAQAGRRDVMGPHANAMLVDAIIRYAKGDHEEGIAAWRDALARTMALVESGETDLRVMVVRYSAELALRAAAVDPAFAAERVTDALDIAEPAIRSDEPTEGLEAEARYAIRRLRSNVAPQQLPLDWARIDELERRLTVKVDHRPDNSM